MNSKYELSQSSFYISCVAVPEWQWLQVFSVGVHAAEALVNRLKLPQEFCALVQEATSGIVQKYSYGPQKLKTIL